MVVIVKYYFGIINLHISVKMFGLSRSVIVKNPSSGLLRWRTLTYSTLKRTFMQFYSSVSNYRGEGVAVRHPSHYRCREASYKARKCFMQIILLSYRCCYQRVYKAAHILYHSYSCATMWCNYGKKSGPRGRTKNAWKGQFWVKFHLLLDMQWWVNNFFC